jgi:prepilin-type N-terminal cleavage/methylation domain-containing protein
MDTLQRHNNKGFTLVEMVMAIVIIGIVAAILAPIISASVTGFHQAQVRNDLTAQSRVVLERLTREIREADTASITVGAGGTSLSFLQLTGLSGLVDLGGTMAKTYSACNTVIVSAAGTNLNWDNNGDGTVDSVLATNLDPAGGVTFTFKPGTTISSGVVIVALTLTDGGETITFYREIHIRNKLGTVACP